MDGKHCSFELLLVSVPPPRRLSRNRAAGAADRPVVASLDRYMSPASVPFSQRLRLKGERGGPMRAGRDNGVPMNTFQSSLSRLGGKSPGIQLVARDGSDEKRITAEIQVLAPMDDVWGVLTSYEALPSFVPNLERSERLPSPKPGVVRLRQIGCSQSVLWRIEAQVELEVEELKISPWRREVHFKMIEGDFEEFIGRWIVETDLSSSAALTTFLRYDVVIKPKVSFPSKIVSYIVKAGLPANIRAVAIRAESLAEGRRKASGLASWAGVEEDPQIPPPISNENGETKRLENSSWRNQTRCDFMADDSLPSKGPFWPLGSPYAEVAPITANRQARQAARDAAKATYLGTAWVPLPPSGRPDTCIKEALNEQLQYKEMVQNLYPAFNAQNEDSAILLDNQDHVPKALEVHLRRLDGLDYLHRRAVTTIVVNAPASVAWDVISDYEHLAEFVPNLAASERIKLPQGAPQNVIRLRQVGYKSIFYMCLHAEAVLDVVEKPGSEIQFKQVAGDFDKFQGKWMLQEVPFSLEGDESYKGPQTIVKYAVEMVIPTNAATVKLLEPLLEAMVFDDIPRNLDAMKREIERRLSFEKNKMRTKKERKRPKLADMMNDFDVLQSELAHLYGETKTIPTRSDLRASNRSDIEKALAAHGGSSAVAKRIGWKYEGRSRKPKGYWNSLENVKKEIDQFIDSRGLPPGVMPVKNDFVRAERFDIARAIERWGGLFALAEQLDYSVASSSSTSSNSEWREHIALTAASTGLSGKQGLFELASATYKRRSEGTFDDVLASIDLEDLLEGSYSPGEYGDLKDSSLPSARDEIDSW